jgi:hypothetical protein
MSSRVSIDYASVQPLQIIIGRIDERGRREAEHAPRRSADERVIIASANE